MRKAVRRSLVAAVLGLVVAGIVGPWLAGSWLMRPVPRQVGPPPTDLPIEEVEIPSESGSLLHGWLVVEGTPERAVVLLHGVRGNRRSMLPRARFLHAAGFAVLLFDFQAHGESPGEVVTFGHLEARDARAAVDFLRRRLPVARVAAIGASLGGAAALLGEEPLPVDALVLEAVYPTIEDAVANRLRRRLGPLGSWLAPFLLIQLEPRLGIPPSSLRPIERISEVTVPTLVIAGDRDRRTTPDESRRLFEVLQAPKELWLVEGAGHVDLHRFAPVAYEERVLRFLQGS